MQKDKEKQEKRMEFFKEKAIYIVYFVIFVFMISTFFMTGESIQMDASYDIDDQRSTLWPVLISLVATLLGSLITTYVFLKEALDRTVDERPYYSAVIQEYRERIMKHLWHYSVGTLLLMAFVVFLYIMFYYFNRRAISCLKFMITILYGICMLDTAKILWECIDINAGLKKTAGYMIKRKNNEIKQWINKKDTVIERICGKFESVDTLKKWMQIEETYDTLFLGINKEKFVNKFSDWERFLLILTEADMGIAGKKTGSERIHAAILDGEVVFKPNNQGKDIEESDAGENGWRNSGYAELEKCQMSLAELNGQDFYMSYVLLQEYRDLLRVQIETERRKGNYESYIISCQSAEIVQLFYLFLEYLSVRVFRILPKIEMFFPAGKFRYMNFYSTRFENSAFRASSFEDGVFARSKINNSNFGMSLFRNCEFFNTDSRDCSFSNTLFDKCSFQEAIFVYVDFTGAAVVNCDFRLARFNDSILSNMEISDSKFQQNDFRNSKIWNIKIFTKDEIRLENCDFTECDLRGIKVIMDEVPVFGRSNELDSVSRQYLDFILASQMEGKYWKEDMVDSDARVCANAFLLKEYNFFREKTRKADSSKWKILSKHVWDLIQETAVIQMKGCVFTRAILHSFEFYRVNMEQSVFIETQMDGVRLLGVYMPGCIMTSANMREGVLCGVNLKSAVLDNGIFYKAECKLVNLEDASLKELHASETKITYCSFNRSDCSSIDLTKAVITNSLFVDTILQSAELTNATFRLVNFENGIADGMLSSYSRFKNCLFVNAYLERSNFNYTNFTKCDFSFASLADSTVTGVEFHNCNFKQTNFRNTCFINAHFENSDNIESEMFENCVFINPKFSGKDKYLKDVLADYIKTV